MMQGLTARQRLIARLIAQSLTNNEVAQLLSITEGTVKVHLHKIYRLLGVRNRVALAVLAAAEAGGPEDITPNRSTPQSGPATPTRKRRRKNNSGHKQLPMAD